ncbi:DUF2332 domain-containing protein [Paenibacillus mendelii]|uniref:DUF2332 domain-containing protein n=1 Tax=Paenibacillus mendelii TaxID=206163 RepID=A0ABV6J3Z8_9BACL|nr:DUF2332 domain-containing protein [Paenibacillus mendelii]MCQ6562054.1 DUF2332 domain-containing protein [Paenibacillus mendelii]
MDRDERSNRFRNFALHECRGSSSLYEYLAMHIAEDDELLDLASHARPGQPIPNLFFGAVHYLLQQGIEHELSVYYRSLVDPPRAIGEQAFSAFQSFCRLYRDPIIAILQNKYVQTNEVRRCAYLYPSFCHIYGKVQLPLALIEIGTSAGLQLLWDTYSYRYQSEELLGAPSSPVQIQAELRGHRLPPLMKNSPPVAFRRGIDLHINDLTQPDDYAWLKSLIWPEHQDRAELFEKAARHFQKQPVPLIEGDGIASLRELADQVPAASALCVFHTHVANQLSPSSKNSLIETIHALGQTRDVFHLYNNLRDANILHLDYYLSGQYHTEKLAITDGHGRWFQWELA